MAIKGFALSLTFSLTLLLGFYLLKSFFLLTLNSLLVQFKLSLINLLALLSNTDIYSFF